MRNTLLLLILLQIAAVRAASAQDTFSLVAIDSVTGEIGAAGASCTFGADLGPIINRILPGFGACNLQSHIVISNLEYALQLMKDSLLPQQIEDSLYKHDTEKKPWNKQSEIIEWRKGKMQKIAFTGDSCSAYAGSIIGPNYVIAGNILSGRNILDSMEKGFTSTSGRLPEKLMAALLKAKLTGADRRCFSNNTSSLIAFIRTARPSDSVEHYWLDLNVGYNFPNEIEPIDTLYARYRQWKAVNLEEQNSGNEFPAIRLLKRSAYSYRLEYTLVQPMPMHILLYNLTGQLQKTLLNEQEQAGTHGIEISLADLKSGTYILRVNGLSYKVVRE